MIQKPLVNVNFPKSGMGIDEGTVLRWCKAVGNTVSKDELLVEIETAKAVQEVLAPVGGVLREILVPTGETVPVNRPLAIIEAT